jgi:hypothetical protein
MFSLPAALRISLLLVTSFASLPALLAAQGTAIPTDSRPIPASFNFPAESGAPSSCHALAQPAVLCSRSLPAMLRTVTPVETLGTDMLVSCAFACAMGDVRGGPFAKSSKLDS